MCKTQNDFNLNVETKFYFHCIYNSEEDCLCDFKTLTYLYLYGI